ncbi:DUF6361 family protein [Stenotrophomonas lacuserhaii]|uniref:DUF6361 family protein n=1 Tax=Stenotrophomonas lacuserhaii TaxID=2760084 RepID=UPI0015F921A7|nr:DUF6361 family protein [Stenotrophomonas lacuserhaii]
MPSSLTWLDHDTAARERSHRLLEMFKESDTRDELGIGAIRDSIADQLFPGTSVIQTRLRYALMVPWLLMQLEHRLESSAKFPKVARQAELDLSRLLSTTDEKGVFGRSAGDQLKRLASSVYWAGMGSWGIRVYHGSQQEYFRQVEAIYAARARRQRKDDGDWLDPHRGMTWHPALGQLMPEDFPDHAQLELSRDESLFLREQWKKTHPESLLAWLAFDAKSLDSNVMVDAPWLHPRQEQFPVPMKTLVEHGRQFSALIAGAALVYNLRLCEVDGRQESVEQYKQDLKEWSDRWISTGLNSWKVEDFWASVDGKGHSISSRTRSFVGEWLRILKETGGQVVGSSSARALIERREQNMKGARSRFTNHAARKQWGGASGLVPLTYRWGITSVFLDDLAAGLEAA